MKIKKIIAMLSIASLLVPCLVSCSGNTGGNSKGASQADVTSYKDFTKYTPEITLTTDRYVKSEEEITDWDNDPYNVWCRENLGINWQPKVIAATQQEHDEKILIAAQSDDLPDVLVESYNLLPSLMQGGFLRCIQEDIEKWGSPLANYVYFDEYQKVRNGNGFAGYENEEGKAMAIPLVLDPLDFAIYTKPFYRADILDELGMSVPTNIEELTAVLTAYVKKYKKPAVILENHFWSTAGYYMSLFGARPGFYYEKDGEIVYGGIQPEIKQGLALLRDWYAAGIINKNYNILDYGRETAKFQQGEYFMQSGEIFFPNFTQSKLEENGVTGARVESLPLLKNADGEYNKFINNLHLGWLAAVTTKCQYPEAIIYEMNENLESQLRNELDLREKFEFKYPVTEPQTPLNPDEVAAEGIEVALYNYAENEIGPGFFNKGNAVSKSVCFGYSRAVSYRNNSTAAYAAFKENNGDLDKTLDALTGSAKTWFTSIVSNPDYASATAIEARFKSTELLIDAVDKGLFIDDGGWSLIKSTPAQLQYAGVLDELERATVHKIIRGEAPLDDFDKFVSQWKAQGGEQILKEKNDLYKSLKNK